MKKSLIPLLFFLVILFLSSATLAYAADEITPILCNVAKAIFAASWAAIGIAWIVVTVLFLIALGNPEKFNMAKKGVIIAIIGTVIIMLNTSAINIIENAIGAQRGGGNVCDVGSGNECNPPCESSAEECKDGICVPKFN